MSDGSYTQFWTSSYLLLVMYIVICNFNILIAPSINLHVTFILKYFFSNSSTTESSSEKNCRSHLSILTLRQKWRYNSSLTQIQLLTQRKGKKVHFLHSVHPNFGKYSDVTQHSFSAQFAKTNQSGATFRILNHVQFVRYLSIVKSNGWKVS